MGVWEYGRVGVWECKGRTTATPYPHTPILPYLSMQFKRKRRYQPEINVINFIDVLLMLLIFFMISTTFIKQPGIRVDLPLARSGTGDTQEGIVITITNDNTLFLNGQKVTKEVLYSNLRQLNLERQDHLVVIRADKKVEHGWVVAVMDTAKTAGFNRFAIATKSQ